MFRLMPFTRRTLATAAALASLVAIPALAQPPAVCGAAETSVRTGDARLARFTPLAPDSVEMTLEREGAPARAFGVFTQRVERVRVDGRQALLFVQRGTAPRGVAIDSVWVDARTWAPIRHVAQLINGSFDVAYRDGRAVGRRMRGDTAVAIDEAIPAGTFDYSVGSIAVRAMPWCEGATIRVSGFDPATASVRDVVYHVLGADEVEIGGAKRGVWAADVAVGGRTVRTLVDRATGRELAWKADMPNGSSLRGTSVVFGGR